MEHLGPVQSTYGIENHGIHNAERVYWNLSPSALVEETIRRGLGTLSAHGALVVDTGKHTGRSPNDKFIVEEPTSKGNIDWGKVNRPFPEAAFDRLHARMTAYMQGRDLFVLEAKGGAASGYGLPLRVVTTSPWHALFAHTMFLRPSATERQSHEPEFTVLHAPTFEANPAVDGTNSSTFIIVNYAKKLVLIGGTRYAGEIKKSVFSILNYLLPLKGVLPMHASLNVGPNDDAAVFFGLSGTGKTTLSADPSRTLIGDDEHGWSDVGTFNFEGGCYAKAIRLSAEAEPDIWAACHRFGTVLENVDMDPATRHIDFDSDRLTENTRAAYTIDQIRNASMTGVAGHPKTILMLTADAYGVLPPIARLSSEQAMYHFISGYTAKVAGTERGVTEPQATFSACFGAPFLPMHPTRYAEMLGKKIQKYGAQVWLVNTGWTGGPYGVGSRMKIAHTRAMVQAALSGALKDVALTEDPVFRVGVPASVPGVPSEVLSPRSTWSDKGAYDKQSKELARRFKENFEKFSDQAGSEIAGAGPAA
jgi:phosphoenolpyruvate carboxykinase (ATP)